MPAGYLRLVPTIPPEMRTVKTGRGVYNDGSRDQFYVQEETIMSSNQSVWQSRGAWKTVALIAFALAAVSMAG